jgi:hypothetical protein
MRSGTVVAISMFLAMTSAGAQQSNELLQPVNSEKSLRLEEYNDVFLKEQLYFAARHRIVKADAALLLTASEITVTPFDDGPAIHLVALPGSPQREFQDEHIFWRGRYREYPLDIFGPDGPPPPSATIASHAWDLDPSGQALISSQNRFEFSPNWTFDEAGNPVLEKNGAGSIGGPSESSGPPKTPEQIARHKQLKSLNTHAFYSVDAVFEPPGVDSRYVLMPLKYTPKYSVIFEIPRDTATAARIDVLSPEDAKLSDEEIAVGTRHRDFLNKLPKETNKAVVGDVP